MKNVFSMLKLKKEAVFLDSSLYIIKSFIAVIAAYIFSYKNPILKLDIISVLFGLMLTLEPVNLTGIRNGLNQLYSTVLGALSTALIIYILGINIFSIALSVALTLYVCLKIDWRAVSPVAIFTSIYMTQYVQKNAAGETSILLTFRLRIFALVTGILTAILFNFIFSRFYYRSMANRRVSFLLESMIGNLNLTILGMEEQNKEFICKSKLALPNTFNDIDWVFSLFQDLRKEYKSQSSIAEVSIFDLEKLLNTFLFLRTITHLNYDINYVLLEEDFLWENVKLQKSNLCNELKLIVSEMEKFVERLDKKRFNNISVLKIYFENDVNFYQSYEHHLSRIFYNIQEMKKVLLNIFNELGSVNPIKKD